MEAGISNLGWPAGSGAIPEFPGRNRKGTRRSAQCVSTFVSYEIAHFIVNTAKNRYAMYMGTRSGKCRI